MHAVSVTLRSTLSSAFHPTSSSFHSLSISCISSCTSSTTMRAVGTLRNPPKRRWTQLTNPTSTQIRCYWIAKFYCTRNGSLTASSARNPRDFGPQAYVGISVFGEVSTNTVLPFFVSPLLQRLPNLNSLFQRNVRAYASPGPLDYL